MGFPPLAFGGDFLSGFTGESDNIRKSNEEKQARADARSSKVFEALAHSDDPDIRTAAVTGWLTGNPPSKGMDKWFGKVSEHPIYATIKGLVNSPVQSTTHVPASIHGEGAPTPAFESADLPGYAGAGDPAAPAEDVRLGDRTYKSYRAQLEGPNTPHAMHNSPPPSFTPAHDVTISRRREVFMDPAKRHAAEVGNDIDAQMSGIGRSGLSPDDQRRAKMGAFNAPPPRALPLQPGTIHRKDGSTTAGFFDPSSGEHYDVNYQFVDDAVRFERGNGGTSSASSGGKWSVEKDSKSSTGWRQVHRDAAGAVLGQGGEAAAPGGPPSFSFLPTPGGIVTGNNRTGAVAPAAGGEGVQRPAAPGTDLNALREIEASILRLHKRPEGFGAGLSPAPAKMQAWRASLDEEAKKYNYPDFAALQAAMGGAATNVGDVTPPPQVPPGLGAKPVPKGTKDKANTGKGKIDVNAILGELAKARKGVATAPAPPK